MTRILVTMAVMTLALGATGAAAQDSGRPRPTAPSKKPPPLSKTEEQQMAVQNAKARFMAAVGTCVRPEKCDPNSPAKDPELAKLLQTAEANFMEACVQCASDKGCEQERTRIRDGRGKYGYNVCVIEAQKASGKKPATTGSKGTGSGTQKAPAPAATAKPAAPQGSTGPSK
jgi:hypothetical protein